MRAWQRVIAFMFAATAAQAEGFNSKGFPAGGGGGGGTAASIAPSTTTIVPSINCAVLYDNGGILGEDADHCWDDTNNRLGINTTAPTGTLEVVDSRAGDDPPIRLINNGNANFMQGFRILAPNLAAGSHVAGYAVGTAFSARNTGYMAFYNDFSGSASNRLTFGFHSFDDLVNILANGNVGMGTTAPGTNLSVVGVSHPGIEIGSGTAGQDTTFSMATAAATNDMVMFLDESDSQKLKFAFGNVLNSKANRDAQTKVVITQAGIMGIGTTTPDASSILTTAGDIFPSVDDSFDLGDDTHRWRDIFLGPATLHIGTSTTDEGTATYDTATNTLTLDATGSITIDSALAVTGIVTLSGSTGIVFSGITNDMTSAVGSGENITIIPDGVGNLLLTTDQVDIGTSESAATVFVLSGGNNLFDARAGSTSTIGGMQLRNSAGTATGIVAYNGTAVADADLQNKFQVQAYSIELLFSRFDNVAAGTTAFTFGDNVTGTMATLMTLDGEGVVRPVFFGSQTDCADSTGAAACGAAPVGSVVIDAGATTVVVSTTAVGANSQIFVFEDSSLGTRLGITCNATVARTYAASARTAATSFTITASAAPAVTPACLNYFIVNKS